MRSRRRLRVHLKCDSRCRQDLRTVERQIQRFLKLRRRLDRSPDERRHLTRRHLIGVRRHQRPSSHRCPSHRTSPRSPDPQRETASRGQVAETTRLLERTLARAEIPVSRFTNNRRQNYEDKKPGQPTGAGDPSRSGSLPTPRTQTAGTASRGGDIRPVGPASNAQSGMIDCVIGGMSACPVGRRLRRPWAGDATFTPDRRQIERPERYSRGTFGTHSDSRAASSKGGSSRAWDRDRSAATTHAAG
jgi:hypothetical protein